MLIFVSCRKGTCCLLGGKLELRDATVHASLRLPSLHGSSHVAPELSVAQSSALVRSVTKKYDRNPLTSLKKGLITMCQLRGYYVSLP